MSRVCELSGKSPMVGHNVSHSNIKTKRRFLPNLINVTLQSEALNRSFKMRIAASTLRTVDKLGGLDNFLLKAKKNNLPDGAAKLRNELERKLAEANA